MMCNKMINHTSKYIKCLFDLWENSPKKLGFYTHPFVSTMLGRIPVMQSTGLSVKSLLQVYQKLKIV